MPRSYRIAALAAPGDGGDAGRAAPGPGQARRYAGPTERGFLLPNGWTLSPAGDQVVTTDMVLDILPTPDGKHALVATSGYNAHELIVVDLASKQVVDKETVRQSWFGLALDAEAGQGLVVRRRRRPASTPSTSRARADPHQRPPSPCPTPDAEGEGRRRHARRRAEPGPNHFKAGLALRPGGETLYSLDIDAGTLTADRHHRPEARRGPPRSASRPYDVASPATASCSTSPTGPAGPSWRSRPERPPRRRHDRRRRAPQPDRRPPRGRPDLRRLRVEQLRLGDRHRRGASSPRRS